MAENFNRVFAESGGKTAINDVEYADGWDFIGDNPPEVEDFNSVMNEQDLKLQELNGSKISSVLVTVLTVSDPVWTPNPLAKSIEFTVIGGGGGGGGVDGQGAGTAGASGGGGGGGSAIKTISTVDATYNITIGAGGAGGAPANDGSNGGATTIVSTNVNIAANGGRGGIGITATTGTTGAGIGNKLGGTATGGDVNVQGSRSGAAKVGAGEIDSTSFGGSSILGMGAPPAYAALDPGADDADFSGGGGGGVFVKGGATNDTGGTGADGIVIIREYI
mgnify:CR=1 FL=1|tara:strand:- start:1257 stop:2087 length:831 start_codon:yes stop_codon:yes gene_type:complete